MNSSNVGGLVRREAAVLSSLLVLVASVVWSETQAFALTNLVVQLALFAVVAIIPALVTLRMSYVDIAWPFGLVALGVLTLVFGDSSSRPVMAVAVIYVIMGARMGIGGLVLLIQGELDKELPRYRYQRLRWRRASFGSERADLTAEILVQALSNVTFLAIPAALAVASDRAGLGIVSAIGIVLWSLSWALESTADVQKHRFVSQSKRLGVKRSCNVGLWRYSRHPNYFFQWMQWNSLVLITAPLVTNLFSESMTLPKLAIFVGLLGTSATMYYCLVYYTGAVPAEHYSVLSRPDYASYQARTNRFFPGIPGRRPKENR